jgi:hypothetical protein
MKCEGDEEGERSHDFLTEIGFDKHLESTHQMWNDFLRDSLAFHRIQESFDDA